MQNSDLRTGVHYHYDEPGKKYEQERRVQRSTPLALWFRLTTPLHADEGSFEQREIARRGYLLSVLVLLITIIVCLAFPIAIFTHDQPMLTSLLSGLVFNAITIWQNRKGAVTAAGLITVIPMSVGFAFGQIMTPGGLHVESIQIFNFLVASEIVAVSIFPPRYVFIVAIGNSLLIWAVITFSPHSADLAQLLAVNRYGTILIPICMQFIVAIPAYLLVRSIGGALRRAEGVVKLEREMLVQSHIIADQAQALVEQRKLLDQGIQQILQTHIRAAKGDLSARAPRTQDNVLWQIGISLNNLLARLQRMQEVETQFQELQRTQQNIALLTQALYKSKMGEQRDSLTQNDLYEQQLVQQLNGMVNTTRPVLSVPSQRLRKS